MTIRNLTRGAVILSGLLLLGGCANNAELERQVAQAMTAAQQAQSTAQAAQSQAAAANQTAQQAAQRAQAAQQAAQQAQQCCNNTNEKIDRMFRRSMQK